MQRLESDEMVDFVKASLEYHDRGEGLQSKIYCNIYTGLLLVI